jgi:hypothetical protein
MPSALDLPGIGQTIELLTVPGPSDASTTTTSFTVLPTSQATTSQSSADSLLQELKSLIQQSPADIVPMNMDPKAVQQPTNTKSSIQMAPPGSRQARTANTYGGTPVASGASRPGTAVKSTVSASGGATMRKSFQQQTVNDDRMFFGRPTSSAPTTIGQGQYHNRTGLMSTNKSQQPSMAPSSVMGQQRRANTSTGMDYHQASSQRRPLSWFQ